MNINKISFIFGYFIVVLGAYLIHYGLPLMITGAFLATVSYIELCKEEKRDKDETTER